MNIFQSFSKVDTINDDMNHRLAGIVVHYILQEYEDAGNKPKLIMHILQYHQRFASPKVIRRYSQNIIYHLDEAEPSRLTLFVLHAPTCLAKAIADWLENENNTEIYRDEYKNAWRVLALLPQSYFTTELFTKNFATALARSIRLRIICDDQVVVAKHQQQYQDHPFNLDSIKQQLDTTIQALYERYRSLDTFRWDALIADTNNRMNAKDNIEICKQTKAYFQKLIQPDCARIFFANIGKYLSGGYTVNLDVIAEQLQEQKLTREDFRKMKSELNKTPDDLFSDSLKEDLRLLLDTEYQRRFGAASGQHLLKILSPPQSPSYNENSSAPHDPLSNFFG